ncbi:hypothetical protein D6D12_08597 [Aureobasidium pullulans]|uniref:CCZ1/INTU/HSP4 first Longin domain-containing protein n=1 Tax=Aureobasidium pullulans TaxID=5580 RepID=A0AB74JJ69_AURPU|nr:hypothetical protein D6D12_08597 [Aureobasidium pullulans]THX30714.1 hypothetical protein D6D11_09969 [Aureobasidium pullulans]
MEKEQFSPAQLSFFAIYSPPLGPTDETFGDQVVFYYSRSVRDARLKAKATADEDRLSENEKLRQIGLAQGMAGFARNFSDGEPIEAVETEKSRILIHELEKDWWVLALTYVVQSVDLTRLPSSNKEQEYEYSSREVSPAPLLLQQVLAAYRVFTLHHGPSISDMYVKLTRDKFTGVLDRFWSRFCRNWDVLLHGNPAIDIFGGLKLAAGGELGYGVGEEDWGSGDREVLEDLVHRTEGLVDLLVHRFGEAAPPENDFWNDDPSQDTIDDARHGLPWLGCGHEPQAPDGLIFSGVGAITRPSIRDISVWIRDIYAYGEHAYGVKDNPHRQRRKRRRRQPVGNPDPESETPIATEEDLKKKAIKQLKGIQLPPDPRPQMHDRVASHDHATGDAGTQVASHPGIPPPIVSAVEASLNRASASADSHTSDQPAPPPEQSSGWGLGSSDKWVKYLSFGLASGGKRSESPKRPEGPRRTSTSSSRTVKGVPFSKSKEDKDEPPMRHLDPNPDGYEAMAAVQRQRNRENKGQFLIGYQGDLDREPAENDDDSDTTIGGSEVPEAERNLLRTIKVDLTESASQMEEMDSRASFMNNDTSSRFRVLVYVHRPFIHVFLFEQRTPSLTMTGFYRYLHKHLRPLHKSLLNSTSAQKVAERIAAAHTSPPEPLSINPQNPPYAPPRNSPVFDLVFDPVNLTCHTSLPNIPEPGQITPQHGSIGTTSSGRDAPPQWTRLEALNVHSHILFTLQHSFRNPQETERTSKTSRHWWIVWLRVPQPGQEDGKHPRPEHCRTAFLVRKARDHVVEKRNMGGAKGMASRVSSGMYNLVGARGGGGQESGSDSAGEDNSGNGWGSAAALAGGIGIDARKYVENLLSLNR